MTRTAAALLGAFAIGATLIIASPAADASPGNLAPLTATADAPTDDAYAAYRDMFPEGCRKDHELTYLGRMTEADALADDRVQDMTDPDALGMVYAWASESGDC